MFGKRLEKISLKDAFSPLNDRNFVSKKHLVERDLSLVYHILINKISYRVSIADVTNKIARLRMIEENMVGL